MKPKEITFELWRKQKEEEVRKEMQAERRDKFVYRQGDLTYYPPKKRKG